MLSRQIRLVESSGRKEAQKPFFMEKIETQKQNKTNISVCDEMQWRKRKVLLVWLYEERCGVVA